MNLYYIHKCQILVDMILGSPLHINATQEMVDELKQEGFIDKFGLLTKDGENAAKAIGPLFMVIDNIR